MAWSCGGELGWVSTRIWTCDVSFLDFKYLDRDNKEGLADASCGFP